MKYRITCIIITIAVLAGCRPFVHYDPDRNRGGQSRIYTVNKGDTLYSIAWDHGHDYRTVARWNGIDPPYTIYPGQEIRMYPAPTATRSTGRSTPVAPAPTAPAAAQSDEADDNRPMQWQWPVKGKIVNTFSGSDPGKKGLDIAGSAC